MDMLGIFVKEPIPGQVKTRLAVDVGTKQAAEIYRAFQLDTIARFRHLAGKRFLCYAPDETSATNYFAEQGGDEYKLWAQPNVSLGERMHQFFCHAFNQNAQRVVVIGSDSPTLPESLIEKAFEQLEESDVVIGPATDGGFYLIGQRTEAHSLFAGIEWSQPTVLSQMVQQIEQSRITLSLLSPWYDVDTQDDLLVLKGHLQGLRYSNNLSHMNRTIQIIETGQGGRTEE